jgi:UDP-N-acetyl-D-mannosaminuronic acid dehydrogenase
MASRTGESGASALEDQLDPVVLGGGARVGLPLSLAFAQAGLRVGTYDIATETLDLIERGQMPLREAGADELLAGLLPTGRLVLSASPELLERTSVVVVIGTPIDEFMNPSFSVIERLAARLPQIRGLKNELGPGVLNAMRAGLAAA